jgi:hypothetical protein
MVAVTVLLHSSLNTWDLHVSRLLFLSLFLLSSLRLMSVCAWRTSTTDSEAMREASSAARQRAAGTGAQRAWAEAGMWQGLAVAIPKICSTKD